MRTASRGAVSTERGFSLVEIVIAMMVLALMTLGLLPLMLQSVQSSTSNKSLVEATAFANAQVAELRASFGNDTPRSCSELIDPSKPYLATGIAGPEGSGLTADRTAPASPCGGDKFDTVTITVTVRSTADPGHDLVTLTTEILVRNP